MSENFSSSLAENLLVLLVFSDETAPLIINNVKVELFENVYYQNIVKKTVDYYNLFKETPKQHIADLLETELKTSNAEIYLKILNSIYQIKETVNIKYVLKSLDKFVRTQNIKLSIKKIYELVQNGRVDDAEEEMEAARKTRLELFEPGVFFGDTAQVFSSMENFSEDMIFTGIKELDLLEHVPTRKELMFLMGLPGKGKSWGMSHLAKFADLQRKNVLYISLELGEKRLVSRQLQSYFGLMARKEDSIRGQLETPVFQTDKFGNLIKIDFKPIPSVKSLRDKDITAYLKGEYENIYKPKLLIKEFPSGSLTVSGLKAYLDNLESYYNYIPDLILLDYLDLMDMSADKLRIDLGRTGVELRGLAIERNIAIVSAAQANRTGEDRLLLTRKNLGEDYSKVKTGDVLLTYNKTFWEEKRGLARIYIDKGRNNRDGDVILLSQNFTLGQFCLSSAMLGNYYTICEKSGIKQKKEVEEDAI
jgi:replicative DNA helicase